MGFFGSGVLGNVISGAGTALHLPELGISEQFNGNQTVTGTGAHQLYPGSVDNSQNTGYNQQQAALQTGNETNTNTNIDTNNNQTTDPYAQYGGQAAYNSLVNNFNTQKSNVYGTALDAAGTAGGQYNRSILDYVDSLRSGQANIDSQANKNELAKMQGTQGVLGMVGRGIQSGGVLLANKNAGDSSAAGAIANAYGQLGQRQLANVGNQYELGNQDIQKAQGDFAIQQASGLRNLQGSKTDAVNNIVNEARNKFAQLNADAANASLPDRIAIEQEKESVRSQVLAQLQQYDQLLQTESSKVAPTSLEQRRTAAVGLRDAGTNLGADAFNFTTEAPAQFQGQSPAGGNLPIFTYNRKQYA